MDKRKLIVRIFCLIMAVLLVLTAFAGVASSIFTTQGYAAEADNPSATVVSDISFYDPKNPSKKLLITTGGTYNIHLKLTASIDDYNKISNNGNAEIAVYDFGTTSSNWESKADSATLYAATKNEAQDTASFTIRISNVRCSSKSQEFEIRLFSNDPNSTNGAIVRDFFILDKSYFSDTVKETDPDTETKYEAATVLESIFAQDKNKKDIEEIDEDTEPFTLVVTFLDFGLDKVDFEDIPDRSLSVYLSNSGGFKTKSNLRGEMTRLNASRDGTARFKVEFPNLTYEKGGAKEIEFTVIYEFDGAAHQVKIPATVRQVKTPDEDEDKEKIAPLKPYIIADYSWGKDDIVAGTEFPLTINYRNTSTDINLENIVMVITTPETISIASSSNSVFVPTLDAQASLTHTINLIAKPKAEIGSAEITIDFEYQYVDKVNKKREEGKSTQKVGIPLTQIDRFAVDPITETPDYASQNEPFYVTVSFINRGKSPTYNISASVKSKKEFTAASQHFGNLDPGKSDSLELSITPQDDGEFVGEVVITYEDENTNEKEIVSDFTVYVQEPYVPDPNEGMFPVDEFEEKPETPKATIVLSVLGSLFIAAPIGFYFVKKSKSKESGAFDEDF